MMASQEQTGSLAPSGPDRSFHIARLTTFFNKGHASSSSLFLSFMSPLPLVHPLVMVSLAGLFHLGHILIVHISDIKVHLLTNHTPTRNLFNKAS